jgi:hypothetical protein
MRERAGARIAGVERTGVERTGVERKAAGRGHAVAKFVFDPSRGGRMRSGAAFSAWHTHRRVTGPWWRSRGAGYFSGRSDTPCAAGVWPHVAVVVPLSNPIRIPGVSPAARPIRTARGPTPPRFPGKAPNSRRPNTGPPAGPFPTGMSRGGRRFRRPGTGTAALPGREHGASGFGWGNGQDSNRDCPMNPPSSHPGGMAKTAEPMWVIHSLSRSNSSRRRWMGTNWRPGSCW